MRSVFDLVDELLTKHADSDPTNPSTLNSQKSANPQGSGTLKPKNQGNVILFGPHAPPSDPASDVAIQASIERTVAGLNILPSEFRSMIDDDEATWIASGRIPIKTARAFARLFAEERARDGLHPSKCGQVTCWSCSNYRGKQCIRRKACHADLWHRCESYEEIHSIDKAGE